MKRRDFLKGLVVTATATSLPAFAFTSDEEYQEALQNCNLNELVTDYIRRNSAKVAGIVMKNNALLKKMEARLK